MTNEDAKRLLALSAAKLEIALAAEQCAQLMRYMELLLEWNKKMNLTAITEPGEIITKHFADSLSVLAYVKIPQNATVVDIGTGAGFPGAVMKIARPDLRLTLLDSLQKRVNFLNALIGELGLTGISAAQARAEEGGASPEYRERYDIAVSRAVARLNILCEYCLPYVKTGGLFIAMKSGGAAEELEEASPAISLLGGKLVNDIRFTLPESDIGRNLLVIKKIRQTPGKFPRNQAQISKKPLV